MTDITREEIMDDFTKDMMQGSGDMTSELGDKSRILAFIKTINNINAQGNPDIGLKVNFLDALWEELEVKAEEERNSFIQGGTDRCFGLRDAQLILKEHFPELEPETDSSKNGH